MINARDILDMPLCDIWNTYDKPLLPIQVRFDDGVVNTTGRELIFSQYFWHFHRRWPRTPLEIKHLMRGDVRLNKGTSLVLIGNAFWSVWDAYRGEVPLDILQREGYSVANTLYNEMVLRIPEYVTSLSAKDITEVVNHPEIVKAIEETPPTQYGIAQVGKKVQAILKRAGELIGNRPAESAKSGLIGPGPISQLFAMRGFVTEIDSHVFSQPILTNYSKGMRSLHDYAIESRSASKALFFAKLPLAQVEYKNREFQILAQSMRHLFKGDCGSTHLLPLAVRTEKDLETYQGKYYYAIDPNTQRTELYRITPEDTWLVGTTVHVRSVMGCKCLPKQGVCQACFGEISLQIPDGSVIGHLSIIELCSGIAQNVLSTKHLDGSSTVDEFVIDLGSQNILSPAKMESQISFNTLLKGTNAILTLSQRAAPNLTDLNQTRDLTKLRLSRISNIEDIVVTYDEPFGDRKPHLVKVSIGSRHSFFTAPFLAYIKRVGWTVNEDNNYEIPLESWDFSKPVFELPLKHINTIEFMDEVVVIVKRDFKGPKGDGKDGKSKNVKRAKALAATMEALATQVELLHQTVNERFSLNIAHCELIMSLCLVRDAKAGDFRFPSPDGPREFSRFPVVMANRSLSAAYAHENHTRTILSISSFLNPKRPSHPMDRIYLP